MQAADQFARDGCIVFEGLFGTDFIDSLREEYLRQFLDVMNSAARGTFKVGKLRLQAAVQLSGPFLSAELYANPVLIEFAAAALGENHLIDSLAVVTALPGAYDQHLHQDHPELFAGIPFARASWAPTQ